MTFAIPVQTLYHWASRPDGSLVNFEFYNYTREINLFELRKKN